LHELPQEYWHEHICLEISRALGTPLIIDSATKNQVFGDYARILVDIEFSCHVFNEIMEEQDIYDFKVEVSYE